MYCLRLLQIRMISFNHMKKICVTQMMNENAIMNLKVNEELIKMNTSLLHTSLHPRYKDKAVSKIVKREEFKAKAREATKTTYYSLVVVAGLGLTLYLVYVIYQEFFSSFSCQRVYSRAVKEVTAHPDVQNMLGLDLVCYGEESRRGRRTRVRHNDYEHMGQKGITIQFHIKGQRGTGTVNLDARKGSGYVFLYVQQDHYPHRVVVIQDNRAAFVRNELETMS